MIRLILTAVAALLLPAAAHAGPPARLADLAWLQGTWEGEGIDGAPALEAWSSPAGGQMPGHFRQLLPGGDIMFYELTALVEREDILVYRLKHFNPDLTGWEEKAVVREFPLTAVTRGCWVFSGIAYCRRGANRLDASAIVTGADGKAETLVFRYRRKR